MLFDIISQDPVFSPYRKADLIPSSAGEVTKDYTRSLLSGLVMELGAQVSTVHISSKNNCTKCLCLCP